MASLAFLKAAPRADRASIGFGATAGLGVARTGFEGPQKHLAERALTIQMYAKAAYWLSEQIRRLLKTNGLQ
jgi:hypothetical protein